MTHSLRFFLWFCGSCIITITSGLASGGNWALFAAGICIAVAPFYAALDD